MMLRLILTSLLLIASTSLVQAVPQLQEARLSNGLRILLMEAHNVPMVSMQLSMPAGSAFDPEGKGGTATMLAAMLSDHTAKHDNIAWADLLDREAIRLGGGASRDELHLSLTVLKDALTPGLDALAESLLQPGWHKKRFAIFKQDSLASLQKGLEDPGAQAAEAAASLLYGTHPYGHRSVGNMESLAAITLSDLKTLYRNQIKPTGAILAVSGDITMDELQPMLEARLSKWQGKALKGLKDIGQPGPQTGQSSDVDMPTTQTLVQLLRLSPMREDGIFFQMFVLNHMLGGGGFGSRLMEEVREKRGLVYGVYSYFSSLAAPGPFVITLQTRSDQADQAEDVVRQVLAEMAAGKISKSTMIASKENLTGSFAQRMDSNRERVGLISIIGLYDLPLDYLNNWTTNIEAVTLKQVKEQAARFLKPESWNRVRVGTGIK